MERLYRRILDTSRIRTYWSISGRDSCAMIPHRAFGGREAKTDEAIYHMVEVCLFDADFTWPPKTYPAFRIVIYAGQSNHGQGVCSLGYQGPVMNGWFARCDLQAAQQVMRKLREEKSTLPMKSQAHVLQGPRLSCALSIFENREMRARMRGEVRLR